MEAASTSGPVFDRATELPTADLLELYRRILRIRGFEQRASMLYRDGEIPGFVHLSLGQEASAAGACWPRREQDVLTSNHRGHGHCLANKIELIRDRVWRTRSQLELAVVEYIAWFNTERIHSSLGGVPPVEYERDHARR